ncbi:hypothetical protein RN001_012572 [Aquatica leii]|uniref:Uncharacterized protein n=1 Tax=Aquatica leii TaxID=1421715 RepID=A0AAN7SPJ5_9COLE|nr:hypothetical protein RN001_012572 [Aquatica leii]
MEKEEESAVEESQGTSKENNSVSSLDDYNNEVGSETENDTEDLQMIGQKQVLFLAYDKSLGSDQGSSYNIEMSCQSGPSRVRATDNKFEATVNRWFDECDSDNDDLLNKYDDDMNASDSDAEDNENISNHDTDSEVEIDDDVIEDEEQVERIREDENESSDSSESIIPTCLFGKNLFKWTTEPQNTRTRTRKHNIVSRLPGLRGPNRPTKASPENMGNWLIDDTILTKVLHWTNVRIHRERARYSNNRLRYD